jgi:hypothetical protein
MSLLGRIVDAFGRTLQPNKEVLDEAYRDTEQLAQESGYCTTLMQAIAEESIDINVRQACLVNLKRQLNTRWQPEGAGAIPLEEQAAIKGSIFQAVVMANNNPKLRKVYKQVVKSLVLMDKSWDCLAALEAALPRVESEFEFVGVLLYVLPLVCAFELSSAKDRGLIEGLITRFFPALRGLAARHQGPVPVYLLNKIFSKAIANEYDRAMEAEGPHWVDMVLKVVQLDPRGCPHMAKAGKWALRSVFRLLYKHCADDVKRDYLPTLLLRGPAFLAALSSSMQQTLATRKACYFRAKAFLPFMRHSNLHHFIKPHLEELLNFFIARDLLLTPEQIDTIHRDPLEMLHEESSIESIYETREACL